MDDTLSLRLEKYQLSEGKFFVLCYLFTHDILGNTAPGPSEIAENLSVTRATITGLLDGLERAGLVRRIEQVSDRRTVIVEISAQAKLLLEELLPSILDTVQPIVTERLTEAEQTTLLALLTKLESPLD
jgi:DNA-binding MarR family transcriptional regulator